MNPSDTTPLSLSFGRRMTLLVCFLIFGIFITSIVTMIFMRLGHNQVAALRISAVIQTLLVFIVPALALSIMITRRPDTFLTLDRRPKPLLLLIAVATLIVSIPAVNLIVEWNGNIRMPEFLSGVEQWMKSAEANAAWTTDTLMSGESIGSLIISILIVGIMAGLGEELFFRGAVQRLMITRPMDPHMAIWCTAIIFSLFHMQMYGFVPRLLLGAYFGYAAWWTRCLWIPIIIHIINNTIVVIATWSTNNHLLNFDVDRLGTTGTTSDYALLAASIILTATGIFALRTYAHRAMNVNQTAFCGK